MRRLSDSDLARFSAALIGASLGALLALALACAIFPPLSAYDRNDLGVLDWVNSWSRQERREMGFYLLTLAFGGIGGALGARYLHRERISIIWWTILLAIYVPVMTETIRWAMASNRIAAFGCSIAVATAVFSVTILMRQKSGAVAHPWAGRLDKTDAYTSQQTLSLATKVLVLAGASMSIAILLLPASAREVAEAIGLDMHMASFLIGPATYRFAHGLIPGIDYFTQYSVGTPWLFFFFFAPTAEGTMINAVRFLAVESLFFQLSLFYFLWWFLRSWLWALVITAAIVLTQFTGNDVAFSATTNVARFPLVMAIAGVFVWWVQRDLALWLIPLLAMALSGAIFLNTETSICTCAAIAFSTVLAIPNVIRSCLRVLLLGAITFVCFLLLSIFAFGLGALDPMYLWYLIEPLMLYGSGLGAVPVQWLHGWHWLYDIISPGVALASIGWVAIVARQSAPPFTRTHLAALALMSMIGLFMSAKYVNESQVGVWQINCFGFLIGLAWWARNLVDRLGDLAALSYRQKLGVRALGIASLLLLLGEFLSEPIESYRSYPSLPNKLLGVLPHACNLLRPGCNSTPIAPDDVALIRRRSKPSERIALIHLQDWAYLVEARRASKFSFLPSALTFTDRQLHESLRNIDQSEFFFLPRRPAENFGIGHDNLRAALVPLLKTKYARDGEGTELVAWRHAP